jgi:hypothetical protein
MDSSMTKTKEQPSIAGRSNCGLKAQRSTTNLLSEPMKNTKK